MSEAAAAVPDAPFRELRTLWFQVTGTLCNLACRHCFNSSGPRNPWLGGLDIETVGRYITEAEALGVREFYFTGGEPFLHPDLIRMVEDALAVAPVTILTNGTLIDDAMATRLTRAAAAALYSLEIRISLDGPTAGENDAVRGRGSFAAALRAVRLLADRGLYPIVTATEILDPSPAEPLYERLRVRLVEAGVERPRIKILPVLPMGRCAGRAGERRVTREDLEGFDLTRLQCTETRVVAEGGIYACPILAGLAGARIGKDRLADALAPAALYHAACYTCYHTGLACKNF
jgi:sulfatase maturation enzyme AslB (radical SAM superfamily)